MGRAYQGIKEPEVKEGQQKGRLELDIYEPCGCVYAIKHGHDQRGVINLQSAVQTDNLKDSSDHQEDNGEDGGDMAELIARVLV